MGKSAYAGLMDQVQGRIDADLAEIGFERQGRTYNRQLNGGLVQVISFQMGQYLSDELPAPSRRPARFGKFTVNLGIFMPEVDQVWNYRRYQRLAGMPPFLLESDCVIRGRLGILVPPYVDRWWNLDGDIDAIGADVWRLLRRYGCPFLEGLSSYEAVLQVWQEDGAAGRRAGWFGAPARVVVAIMLAGRGDLDGASILLRDEYHERKACGLYTQFIVERARLLGIPTNAFDDHSLPS